VRFTLLIPPKNDLQVSGTSVGIDGWDMPTEIDSDIGISL